MCAPNEKKGRTSGGGGRKDDYRHLSARFMKGAGTVDLRYIPSALQIGSVEGKGDTAADEISRGARTKQPLHLASSADAS